LYALVIVFFYPFSIFKIPIHQFYLLNLSNDFQTKSKIKSFLFLVPLIGYQDLWFLHFLDLNYFLKLYFNLIVFLIAIYIYLLHFLIMTFFSPFVIDLSPSHQFYPLNPWFVLQTLSKIKSYQFLVVLIVNPNPLTLLSSNWDYTSIIYSHLLAILILTYIY